jgi:hypothetical protein
MPIGIRHRCQNAVEYSERHDLRTVLFTWELGRGAGHLDNIRRLSRRLKSSLGVRIVAALPETAAQIHFEHVDEIVSVPPWPERKPGGASFSTFGDILAARGLADPVAMQHLLRGWDHLFAEIAPDLLIADLAPASALAARGRVPTLLIGNGYTLPPSDLGSFPVLQNGKPEWKEETTVAALNAALRESGQKPIERFPEIFAADARSVQTFAILDPYHLYRTEPMDGPLAERMSVSPRDDAENIFVYLSGDYGIPRGMVQSLAAQGSRVQVHAPRLSGAEMKALTEAGAAIYSDPVSVAEALAASRLVIHTGGSGLAAEAIAAGVPQFILSSHIEQDLNGSAIERAGAGRFLRASLAETEVMPAMLDAMIDDQTLLARARELGELHRSILSSLDALGRCERIARELLRM